MAFRFGHQITCGINKNIFYRSSSADSAHRYKSLSSGYVNRKLNENRCVLAKLKKVNTARARSLPSPEDNDSFLPCRRFFSNKQFGSEFDEPGYEKESTSNDFNTSAKRFQKIKFENKISNTGLQPSNLTPIACTYIHHTPSTQPESSRLIKIDTLKRSASVQYEKAVKALNNQSEDETYRYQLAAAKPKQKIDEDCTFNVRELYQKKYQTVTAKVPQLQPRNIKPYGNINTLPWCAPNVEYHKKSIITPDKNRNKYEKQGKVSKAVESENEIGKTTSNHAQQRDYSTSNKNSQPINTSPESLQCKAIISEYKKINPDYVGKKSKLIPGSEEEKKFIEQTEKFVATVKSNKENNDLLNGMPVENVSDCSPNVPIEENSNTKRELGEVTDFMSKIKKKNYLQHPGKGKIILYYDEKHGIKTLCSKVIKEESAGDVEKLPKIVRNRSELDSQPIKVKVGPKLMLQSSNLKDNDLYSIEELTPAANVKFIAPWLSWGDRVKLNLERHNKSKIVNKGASIPMPTTSLQDPCLKKSSTVFAANTVNDSPLNKQPEIQKRGFSLTSQSSTFFQPEEMHLNFTEMWNTCNGCLRADEILTKRSLDKTFLLTPTMNRSFSTNSTRGVLGPEGTVMVKLRRLPKINIPEPTKDCPEPGCNHSERADGIIKVKQKKLPKLTLPLCQPPLKAKMGNTVPLARLKSRGEPPDPPRICPETEECIQKRADEGFKILPKKLPKIVPSDCFPCLEQKMTSPSLPRLKARPIPPPPPCKEILKVTCPPRADEGLKVIRKKLPALKMSDCCPLCKPEMNQGQALKRLKKTSIPEPKRICVDIEDACPPRADEVLGYTVKRKKLQTLILSEKYNNISWKEFNSKLNKSRNYTTDSKYGMCCYSNKKVHPDIILKNKEIAPSVWDKFDGQLVYEADGKIKTYLPPKEIIDMSTGTELKIIRKPVGSSYRKDEHFHEELLKSGFTTFNTNDRNFCSLTSVLYKKEETENPCALPPDKIILKDLRLKPLRKRKGFDKDFPPRLRFHNKDRDLQCFKKCTTPRMDDVMKYEVKAKSLPILPKGRCLRKERPILKPGPPLIRRLKKKMRYSEYDCPKMCIEKCPPRADDNLIETPKKLPPMVMSKCPKPIPRNARDDDSRVFKRLPKFEPEDPPRCPPRLDQIDCDTASRSDVGKDLYELKNLPKLVPSNCPPKPRPKCQTVVKLARLPRPPFYDREDDCRTLCEKIRDYRSDVLNNYQVKTKKLKVILKSSNKSFSTLPKNFIYEENFTNLRLNRYISISAHLLGSDKKECKRLGKAEDKKKICPKFGIEKCKPAISISCKKKRAPGPPCAKQKSPYPAFSECKDHNQPDVITECKESGKHLQPRWPILNEIINQKPPPPYQGKIDPTKEEECIARKLNMKMEGETKTCATLDKPYKPAVTKEMYDDVMKNPPYDECECENEGEKPPESKMKGPCKPVEHSICKPPEIECTLETGAEEDLSCVKSKAEKKSVPQKGESSKDKPKVICKKKSDTQSESECNEMKATPRKVEKVQKSDTCEEIEHESKQKQKLEEKEEKKPPCKQPQVKECKPKLDTDCQTKKKECEDKKEKSKKTDDSKKDPCRNVKVCKKKGASKKKKPVKCSDLLKEYDKAKKTEKKPEKSQMADICAQKPVSSKIATSKKVPVQKTVSCPAVAPKCPPRKGLLQRILDFFRARPNCPPPDQWKKDKLRKEAERAAAAAGYELCEKKKPKVVNVVCKKTGVKDGKSPSSKCKVGKGLGKGCKRSKSTYVVHDQLTRVHQNALSTSKKEYSTSSKGNSDNCKIASKVKAKECPPGNEKDCIQEESTGKESKEGGFRGGKQCKLPRQKYCKPPARSSCKEAMVPRTCTTVVPPYPSFSECRKRFARLPITECTEQEKNVKRKSITNDYNNPKKGTRNYSTTLISRRFYSSNFNGARSFDLLSFLSAAENSVKDIENQDLALRILTVVKECMKSMASSNHSAKETYYNIFKELELLCEEELNKNMKKEILGDPDKTCTKPCNSAKMNLHYERLAQRDFSNLEDTLMMDPIKKFCNTIFSVPDLSTQNYEESERIKTERLQKKLDEILDNYKMQ